MMEWMENVTAQEALKASFSNKSEEAEDEFKSIMLSLKVFIKSKRDETKKKVKIIHNINHRHLRYLGFGFIPDNIEPHTYTMSW